MSSILRLWSFVTHDYSSPDVTYTTANIVIWSFAEVGLAITSACLPSLRPIVTASISKYIKLRTRYRASSWGRRQVTIPRQRPNLFKLHARNRLSETSDHVELHNTESVQPITNDHNFLESATENHTAREKFEVDWTSRSQTQAWGYPVAVTRESRAGP